MIPGDFEVILQRSLDNGHLSRNEQQALKAIIGEVDATHLPALRSRVFAVARERGEELHLGVLLDQVETLLKLLQPPPAPLPVAEALFSPGEDCRRRLVGLFEAAGRTVDVCVFTITDDAISRAIYDAHRRGVAIRILTDDDKSEDLGSDVVDLDRAGVAVRVDRTPAHMHHKFAIFDGKVLASGSYNWTRSAASENEENVIVTDHPHLVRAFQAEFDQLWQGLDPQR